VSHMQRVSTPDTRGEGQDRRGDARGDASPRPRRGARDEDAPTRTRILDAAIECFSRFGNDKTTLNDIAVAARLSRQTIYRYFPDRLTMLEAVLNLEDDRLRAEVARIAGSEPTFEAFLGALVRYRMATYARYHTRQHLLDADRSLLNSLFLSSHDQRELLRELLVPQLEAARRRGEIPDDLLLAQAAEWIAISLQGLSTLTTGATFDLDDPTEVGRFYAGHLCRGLRGSAA
jgi:AcrR family transcriptional regulator